MKEKYVGIFWGLVLVIVGAYFMITQQYSFVIRDPYLGLAFSLGMSALFFASYFMSGRDRWGWLFPACIFAGVSGTIGLSLIPGELGGMVAAPVMASMAVPFLVAYFIQPQTRRWALIPVYVFAALTLVVMFAERVQGELMGTFVLMLIALPFLIVFLTNRERKWALIPFGVLAFISIIPLMTTVVDGIWMGFAMMLLFTLAFGIVFLFNTLKNWWAMIPMGIFASIAVTVLLVATLMDGGRREDALAQQIIGGVILLGFALTFFSVWLRRGTIPGEWGIYPALVFVLLALVAFAGGQTWLNYLWPIAIIAGGVLMIYNNYRKHAV